MRWVLPLTLLAVAVWPAAAEENEAEKLFRAMEKKVRAARTLRVRFDAQITDARGKKWDLKGSLVLGEGDRFRMESTGKLFGEAINFTVISDGTNARSFGGPKQPKEGEAEKPPKGVGAYFRALLTRRGVFGTSLNIDRRDQLKPDAMELSDFKLAGKDKFNGRNMLVIRCAIREKGTKNSLSLTVWLDAETNLPARWTVSGGKSDIGDITETYAEFTIDPKLDPKLFELPK